ncbi:MAG: nucleoside deaminase [Bacteroidota bacterium]
MTGISNLHSSDEDFMREAIRLSLDTMRSNTGGPFGAVVVKDGKIIARGFNRVLETNDPTAHAEVVAIREACKALKDFQLSGCTIYTSCEPCPMCLAAIYWARPDNVFFGNTKKDAAEIEFDDQFIYDEIELPFADRKIGMKQLLRDEAHEAFIEWKNKTDKKKY